MATLIEMKTPETYAKKGKSFKDWTLDAASIEDNCKRIANELNAAGKQFREQTGRTRAITARDVLVATTQVVVDLGAVVRGHRQHMASLGGAKP